MGEHAIPSHINAMIFELTLAAQILTVGAQGTYLGNNFHARTCYHTYTLTFENVELQGKVRRSSAVSYAFISSRSS